MEHNKYAFIKIIKTLMASQIVALVSVAVVAIAGIIFLVPVKDIASLLSRYWFVIIIAFFAALIANATAIGGGIIFVPVFIYGFGLPAIAALKLSLATQSFGMSSGAFGWGRRFIDKTGFIVGGCASLAGIFLGTYIWNVPPELVKPIFGYLSIFIILALIAEALCGHHKNTGSKVAYGGIDRKLTGLVLTGITGGFITAWIAIGVGELIALYLLFVYRVKIETAVATGVAILAVDSMLGFALHIRLGGIPWDLLLFTVPGVIFGGLAGGKLGKHLDEYVCINLNHKKYRFLHKISPLKCLIILIIAIDTGIMLLL